MDFLNTRTCDLLAVLGDADDQTRSAIVRSLVGAIRDVPTRVPETVLLQAAEHYGRLLLAFPGTKHRPEQAEGLLLLGRILFARSSPSRARQLAHPALEWARSAGRPELHRQAANDYGVY